MAPERPKFPVKVFSDDFLRWLYVADVEQMIAVLMAQEEATKTGKPIQLTTEAFSGSDSDTKTGTDMNEIVFEDPPTNESYTLTIKAPLLRPGMELTVGPMSKRYAAKAIRDALDIVRQVNMVQSGKKSTEAPDAR